MGIIEAITAWGNDLLWTYILIALLIILGIFFTIRMGFVQFRFFGEMFRIIGEKDTVSTEGRGISSFQAFTISTASRVGTGNLAGVAIAIAVGGPGAIFWMWIIALIGMATSFVESTLAQIYKVKDEEDGFRGGPAYYIEKALGLRWLGIVFAILITLCFGLIFNSVQSNTIALSFENAFGMDRGVLGIILAVVTAIIIFGGVKRIANVTQVIVPVMAIIYIGVALIIMIMNITQIPSIIGLIVSSAFGLNEVVGGGMGAAIMQGVRRGLFSNEAGMGSVPNAAATANVSHPAKQGFVQSLGVFVDTMIICSATAFMILLTDVYTVEGLSGIELTQAALSAHIGDWATTFVAIAILLFAFSSIIGNYYYGETNIEFIQTSKAWLFIYRIAVLAMVIFGSMAGLGLVWDLADLFMGMMAVINLIVIFIIGKYAYAALNDYHEQRKANKDPLFYRDSIEGLTHAESWGLKGEKER
ncbi:alanine/glycine:cation symporter family protein [Anaerobacillus sp. MEB173]|uniref:alanine/glycine:cation symporter family protein n=1 Tax=Anaerobacillus sp. MEB173 TaxID=3383345 RepID=UPI003F8F3891